MNKVAPIHPGEHLAEFIEEFGITKYRLARLTHMNPQRIGAIVSGQSAITANTAMRLGKVFGTTAQFWMNLQTRYDLEVAEISHADDIEAIERLAA
ncbi:MAG: HigA family addiction module antidote protein [Mariprofundaceae bacterium]|nr:HigA family addiction module antidote protein [Mariprofundaceae bacterium]